MLSNFSDYALRNMGEQVLADSSACARFGRKYKIIISIRVNFDLHKQRFSQETEFS